MDCLLRTIDRIARDDPGSVAITEHGKHVTYSALQQISAALASELARRKGAECDRPVAFLGTTGIDLVLALVAAHRAAIPFVALDPRFPDDALVERMRQVYASLVLCGSEHLERAGSLGFAPLVVPREISCRGDQTGELPPDCPQETISHIRFTSGSTGEPKAVAVHRAHLESMLSVFDTVLERRSTDRYGLFGHFWPLVIFRALSVGATLECFDFPTLGAARLRDWMEEREVSVMFTYPQLFRQLTDSRDRCFAQLRFVHLSGDQLQPDDVARFERCCRAGAVLHNSYGSTEVPWIAGRLHSHGDQIESGPIPAGQLVFPGDVRLLDRDGAEVTGGEQGEVVVTNAWTGGTPFPTGDLAYLDAAGQLHLVGRTDDQLKIRGARLNPLEIETALNRHTQIKECAVFSQADGRGENRLACQFVPATDKVPAGSELRSFLTDSLPGYMIPFSNPKRCRARRVENFVDGNCGHRWSENVSNRPPLRWALLRWELV